MRVLRIQVGHLNQTMPATIAAAEMSTNSMLSRFGICVIAVVEDHKLNVTEDGFNWVVIGTTFGQADPVQMKVMHDLASEPRLARMGTVLVEDDPNGNIWIPHSEVT